jgi:hypothetical protein
MSAAVTTRRVLGRGLLVLVPALLLVAGVRLVGPADASQPGVNGRVWWVSGTPGAA